MTQESPHLGGPQFGGVPEATEPEEPLGPVDIGGFGAPAQMLEAQVGLQRLREGRREKKNVNSEWGTGRHGREAPFTVYRLLFTVYCLPFTLL
jgi:hypothetical protein